MANDYREIHKKSFGDLAKGAVKGVSETAQKVLMGKKKAEDGSMVNKDFYKTKSKKPLKQLLQERKTPTFNSSDRK